MALCKYCEGEKEIRTAAESKCARKAGAQSQLLLLERQRGEVGLKSGKHDLLEQLTPYRLMTILKEQVVVAIQACRPLLDVAAPLSSGAVPHGRRRFHFKIALFWPLGEQQARPEDRLSLY